MFIADNQKECLTNAYVHGLDTRKNHLYLRVVSLSCVQKGVSYSGVKIFNILPSHREIHSIDRKRLKNKLYNTLLFMPFIRLNNF
jgi:hypothetical protein